MDSPNTASRVTVSSCPCRDRSRMCDRACHASDGGGMPGAGGPAVCTCPAMAAESRAAPRDCGPTGAAQIIPDVGSGLPISASPSSTPLIMFPQQVQTMHSPLGRLFAKREDVMSYLRERLWRRFSARFLWKGAQSLVVGEGAERLRRESANGSDDRETSCSCWKNSCSSVTGFVACASGERAKSTGRSGGGRRVV